MQEILKTKIGTVISRAAKKSLTGIIVLNRMAGLF
jgi:hypothetical protein